MIRSTLLRDLYNLSKNRNQLNLLIKRSVYSKITTKPAPYYTRKVVYDKFKEIGPAGLVVAVIYIFWYLYFTFNGINYNAIINYKETRAPLDD